MSLITLQFGQCGNQIGQTLYSTLDEDISLKNKSSKFCTRSINKWFTVTKKGVRIPRSILIDTETKVIEDLQLSAKKSQFKFTNVIAKPFGGSANNWAFGYSDNGKKVSKEVQNCVRSEVEKSDLLTSFLNIYSLSGGTGSGVGSYIIEELRDEYPKKSFVNCAILPCDTGGVATQSYNCLLNLAHLYGISDSTFLFENDRLLHICKYNLGLNDASFSNINFLISQQLSSVFQPLEEIDSSLMLSNLTSHPDYKFLQVKTEPNFQKQHFNFEGTMQWSFLTKALVKPSWFNMLQYQINERKLQNKIISSVLVTRGSDPLTANCVKTFKESKDYVRWLPKEESFKLYNQKVPFLNYQKYISLIYNSNIVYLPLNMIVDNAWTSFTHGAFLHHYKKYDIDEDYFLESFQKMENILDNYKCL